MCVNATPEELAEVIASVLMDEETGFYARMSGAMGSRVTGTLRTAGGIQPSLVLSIAPCDSPGMTPHPGGTFTLTLARA